MTLPPRQYDGVEVTFLAPGMRVLGGAEDRLRLFLAIDLVDFGEFQDGDTNAGLRRQRDILAGRQRTRGGLVDAERDRNRPRHAGREAQIVAAANVVGLAHEAGQRRERARGEHLEVGDFARAERHDRELFGMGAKGGQFGGGRLQVNEITAAVRGNRIISDAAHRAAPSGKINFCASRTASRRARLCSLVSVSE